MSRDGTGAPSIRQSKAKKARQKFDDRHALRGVILLLLALTIVLMVCGVLYIRDHLAPAPDSKLPDGNVEPDDPALSEPPIVSIEPAIPGGFHPKDAPHTN